MEPRSTSIACGANRSESTRCRRWEGSRACCWTKRIGPEPLPDGSLIVVKLTDQGDNQLFHFWPESGKLEALPAFLPSTDITPLLRAFPDGKEVVYFGTSEKERSQSRACWSSIWLSRQVRELAPGVRADPGGDSWSPLDTSPGGESVYLISKDGRYAAADGCAAETRP